MLKKKKKKKPKKSLNITKRGFPVPARAPHYSDCSAPNKTSPLRHDN